jgi:hypothetical protein
MNPQLMGVPGFSNYVNRYKQIEDSKEAKYKEMQEKIEKIKKEFQENERRLTEKHQLELRRIKESYPEKKQRDNMIRQTNNNYEREKIREHEMTKRAELRIEAIRAETEKKLKEIEAKAKSVDKSSKVSEIFKTIAGFALNLRQIYKKNRENNENKRERERERRRGGNKPITLVRSGSRPGKPSQSRATLIQKQKRTLVPVAPMVPKLVRRIGNKILRRKFGKACKPKLTKAKLVKNLVKTNAAKKPIINELKRLYKQLELIH